MLKYVTAPACLNTTTIWIRNNQRLLMLEGQRKLQRNFLISALVVLTLIMVTSGILFRSNRLKQKAKTKIENRNTELKSCSETTHPIKKKWLRLVNMTAVLHMKYKPVKLRLIIFRMSIQS
jgi:hypothetical protein